MNLIDISIPNVCHEDLMTLLLPQGNWSRHSLSEAYWEVMTRVIQCWKVMRRAIQYGTRINYCKRMVTKSSSLPILTQSSSLTKPLLARGTQNHSYVSFITDDRCFNPKLHFCVMDGWSVRRFITALGNFQLPSERLNTIIMSKPFQRKCFPFKSHRFTCN